MADEEEIESIDEAAEDGRSKKGEGKKGFDVTNLLGALNLQRLLLLGLQYSGVAIITFLIAYCVSSRGGGNQTQPLTYLPQTQTDNDIATVDPETQDVYRPIPEGFDWRMDEMIINTDDEDVNHFVKALIIVSYDKEKPAVLAALTSRSSQIHTEVRKIIGSKKYLELKGINQQEDLKKEIKTRIQLIVNQSGIIDVFLREFTLH